MTLNDIPVELLLIIYEHIDLAGLNSIAQLNSFHRCTASTVFNDKFGKKLFQIKSNHLNIKDETNYFIETIGNMNTMYLTLKVFGHLIGKLSIDYESFSEWESEQINGSITKYIIHSLREIELNCFNDAKLIRLNGPFEMVKKVGMHRGYMQSNLTDLSKIFPAIESIQFMDIQNIKPSIYVHHFPHLLEMNYEYSYNSDPNTMERLFRLNPQLRKLIIDHGDCNFLNTINELLPNIENLQLYKLCGDPLTGGGKIHFKNVKFFGISSMHDGHPNLRRLPLVFDCLEEISAKSNENLLLDVTVNNPNVKKAGFSYLEDDQLQWIPAKLPNLEEFWTQTSVLDVQVIQFIETAKNLRKIQFWNCLGQFHQTIFERIKTEWEMIEGRFSHQVLFVRRQ